MIRQRFKLEKRCIQQNAIVSTSWRLLTGTCKVFHWIQICVKTSVRLVKYTCSFSIELGNCMMTSFHYNYQNTLRQAIVLSIFYFVKDRSCVTQICITKIAAKCILVVVVKWRHHANVLLVPLYSFCSWQTFLHLE